MATELKDTVTFEETLGRLDIRLGTVVDVQPAPGAPKASYRVTIDFGKFGRRVSVGRFTGHPEAELLGKQVVGVLNFAPREIGENMSEVLILGVQFPGAASGEATFLTPATPAKIGSKVF
ncbi:MULTISPECIES: tRNA-binding protein [Deinococcus]|uniref:tRNA-binding protein n=1 Tax=Deinococcus rufus TaxID=2136097 RepID=A0ABV7Z444_9DEIO|nr:tRNA-binding protein [Deinococcus sp. AB2017081]WQE95135.1 tRNA-binding protein [Deinococcus sp. AB2017081]